MYLQQQQKKEREKNNNTCIPLTRAHSTMTVGNHEMLQDFRYKHHLLGMGGGGGLLPKEFFAHNAENVTTIMYISALTCALHR